MIPKMAAVIFCVGLAQASFDADARQATTSDALSAAVFAKTLPLANRQVTKSGDGRMKQQWTIRGIDRGKFEMIGNVQNDADLLGWNCAEYDSKGEYLNPSAEASFCRNFFITVLKQLVPNPDATALDLLQKTLKTKPASVTRQIGDLLIETDGEFYFVRRKSRM